jgi:type I restriction enzyme M protein
VSENNANLVWSIANLLRGPYKPKEYGEVVLPFTILRRLDCVLELTKDAVLAAYEAKRDGQFPLSVVLPRVSKQSFYNTSRYSLTKLGDADHIKANLLDYLNGFSENVRDIFERFGFLNQIERLDENELLLLVTQQFAAVDLHPKAVSNIEMGLLFEELIRKFAESSNETAGEHFTPREVIKLMVELLFIADDDALAKPDTRRSIYDPTAGTGGMLSVADEHLRALNPNAKLSMAGQEINPSSYAVCKADMVIKGQPIDAIVLGDTLTNDGHRGKHFNYCLSNPPFGVEWKKAEKAVREEYADMGYNGRFGPGLPSVSDGSMLFLLHLIDKMRPLKDGGGRAGIVLNGSPLFTGKAGSGESDIRRWVIESDLLEAIIALPTDMFYNTGISTYVWILTNRKADERKGKVQLIDGTSLWQKMRKSLGAKRKMLGPDDINTIVKLYGQYVDADPAVSKVFKNEDFGYRTITVERPLRLNYAVTENRRDVARKDRALSRLPDAAQDGIQAALEYLAASHGERVWMSRSEFDSDLGSSLGVSEVALTSPQRKALLMSLSERDGDAEIITNAKGNPEPDSQLRDTENVPLVEDIEDYFALEVSPHVPDAWIDHAKTRIGYEIPFTRHFYEYAPPRALAEIDSDLNKLISEISVLLADVETHGLESEVL